MTRFLSWKTEFELKTQKINDFYRILCLFIISKMEEEKKKRQKVTLDRMLLIAACRKLAASDRSFCRADADYASSPILSNENANCFFARQMSSAIDERAHARSRIFFEKFFINFTLYFSKL